MLTCSCCALCKTYKNQQLFSDFLFRVVPEGNAVAITLGFFDPEVLPGSCWVWDVPEGDAVTITLGFFVPEVLLRSCWAWDVPEGDAFAII